MRGMNSLEKKLIFNIEYFTEIGFYHIDNSYDSYVKCTKNKSRKKNEKNGVVFIEK